MPVSPTEFTAALGQHASGVCLLTVRDGMDDVGTTVSSVVSVSAAPPLIAVGLVAAGYPAEVLEEVGRCGLTVLAAGHAIVASRFSSAGRPSARHLLESVPWSRAPASDAIVLDGGLVALDCRLERLVEAGDHVLALLAVDDVLPGDPAAAPLLRHRGRYVDETGRAAGRA
ncbi:flavin reductase family protein [Blastococcus sp. CT_GayMR16]|uniref:flavin reductase family protein n=1 Tax=Blastococcus sp. CT_GayMR16 TaxID=2559607 RepID=UPI0010731D9A|nr:flavin reductase family protein [Blastococcus sp. CT_GayMR16]TFV91343.1 flavin reductase [Blastococcus sp. CT_GayMR16]